MQRTGIMKPMHLSGSDYRSQLIEGSELVNVKTPSAGILYRLMSAGDEVTQGEPLARIIDPYEGMVTAEICSPTSGLLFYAYNQPLALQNSTLFKIVQY